MPSTRPPVGGRHIRLLDCVLSTLPEVWPRDKNRILATTMESELFIILGVESLASIDRSSLAGEEDEKECVMISNRVCVSM